MIKKSKIFSFIGLVLILVICISGCGKQTAQKNWYDFNAKYSAVSDCVVSENSQYSLLWNKKTANVTLVDKQTGNKWSTIPEGSNEKTNQPNVISPIIVNYIESGTLNSSNMNSYTASIKGGSFTSERIENGIKVTYYFENISISIPVSYVLRNDSLSVSINPAEIGEDENLVAEIGLMPFFCSVSNESDKGENYLFVPSGSGALIYPQIIGEGITSVITEQMYGYDEQITDYQPTEKQSARLPVYGFKNSDRGVCAIIEGASENASICTNVGSTTYAYSAVYASFGIRGSEISSSTYMGGLKNQKILFNEGKIKNNISVGFYPLQGEKANYSGMAETYRNYLSSKFDFGSEKQDRILTLKIIGGTEVKKSVAGVPYNSVKVATDFSQAAQIVKSIFSDTDEKMNVNLLGFGKNGYDIGKVAGGLNYSKKFGSIKKISEINDLADIYFNFDITHFSKYGNGVNMFGGVARSAIGGKNVKEYVRLYSLEEAGKDDTYYLVNRALIPKLASKAVVSAEKWNISGISLDTFTGSTYSDYSDEDYYVKSGYENQMKEINNQLKKNACKFAATGGNLYAAVYADVIFDAPSMSSKYTVYGDDIPFYQMVFKGLTPMSVPSINNSKDARSQFLKAVEGGMELSYTLVYEYSTDFLTSKQNMFVSTLFEDNRNLINDNVNEYKQLYYKVKNNKILSHTILENGLRCTKYNNGVSVYVNYSDENLTLGDIEVPARGFTYREGD